MKDRIIVKRVAVDKVRVNHKDYTYTQSDLNKIHDFLIRFQEWCERQDRFDALDREYNYA